MDISIVIPYYNEEESLAPLFDWIKKTLEKASFSYEVIFVDDGSRDGSWKIIRDIAQKNPQVKGIRFRRNYGKSAALNEGFKAVKGEVVITMDADMQDSPDEIPELYRMIKEQGYDLVSGWKKKRHDPVSKTVPSRFFNGVTNTVTGIKLHDFNCGLKAYRREAAQAVEIYGEMHRFIPVMVHKAGFQKIGEKAVEHRERKFGKTKFGLERFLNGFLDLLTVLFVTRFGKRPMHLFGFIGTIMFAAGFLAAGYLGVTKFLAVINNEYARLITQRPSFYISLACMIIGSQMFLAGFLGELVSRMSPDRNHYEVGERIG